MKYEYQDLIVKTLLKDYENRIDSHTLKNGKFLVCEIRKGVVSFTDTEYHNHIKITYGKIEDVLGNDGCELDIDFTVYEIFYPAGANNHILCNITLN